MQEDKLRRSYLSGWQGALIPDKLLPLDRNALDQRQVSAHNLGDGWVDLASCQAVDNKVYRLRIEREKHTFAKSLTSDIWRPDSHKIVFVVIFPMKYKALHVVH